MKPNCVLCGHEDVIRECNVADGSVCALCDEVTDHFDAHFTVQAAFVAVCKEHLPRPLRRRFIELMWSCPDPFNFLRAFEITLFDVGYSTPSSFTHGGYFRRPPEYLDSGWEPVPC